MARLPMRIFLTSPSSKMLLGYPVTRSGKSAALGGPEGQTPSRGIRTITHSHTDVVDSRWTTKTLETYKLQP